MNNTPVPTPINPGNVCTIPRLTSNLSIAPGTIDAWLQHRLCPPVITFHLPGSRYGEGPGWYTRTISWWIDRHTYANFKSRKVYPTSEADTRSACNVEHLQEKQAAATLGIDVKQLQAWRKAGTGPPVLYVPPATRGAGHKPITRYPVDRLTAWLDQQEEPP